MKETPLASRQRRPAIVIGIDATDGRWRNEAMMAEMWHPGMAARDCRRKGEGEPLGAIFGTLIRDAA